MVVSHSAVGRFFSMPEKAGLVVATFAGALLLNASVHAQQPAQPAPKAPPATAGQAKPAPKAPAASSAQAKGEQDGAWVKVCDKEKVKDKTYNVCTTVHERFHPTRGYPLISAGIRDIEGEKERMMMFMVPVGQLLAPGLIIQVDEKEPRRIGYSHCTTFGCIAQAPATDEIITMFKKGGKITVKHIDIRLGRRQIEVPLAGFTSALDGPPMDPKVYAQAQRELFAMIRARQVELAKKRAEAAKSDNAGQGAQQKAPAQPAQPAQPKKLQ